MSIALAVALSGYSSDKESLWSRHARESNILSHMSDPYYRAMFKFLTSEVHILSPLFSSPSLFPSLSLSLSLSLSFSLSLFQMRQLL